MRNSQYSAKQLTPAPQCFFLIFEGLLGSYNILIVFLPLARTCWKKCTGFRSIPPHKILKVKLRAGRRRLRLGEKSLRRQRLSHMALIDKPNLLALEAVNKLYTAKNFGVWREVWISKNALEQAYWMASIFLVVSLSKNCRVIKKQFLQHFPTYRKGESKWPV